MGATKKFTLDKKERFTIAGEIDLINTFDGKRNVLLRTNAWSMEPLFGFEAGFRNMIFLRGGIGNIQKAQDVTGGDITTFQPNFGIGLKIRSITIDYAFTDIGDRSVALYSNIFSLKFDLNRTPH
jgi:hypothetical protein